MLGNKHLLNVFIASRGVYTNEEKSIAMIGRRWFHMKLFDL